MKFQIHWKYELVQSLIPHVRIFKDYSKMQSQFRSADSAMAENHWPYMLFIEFQNHWQIRQPVKSDHYDYSQWVSEFSGFTVHVILFS